ncbi:hypothetical protein KBC99_00745 [Candidatus Saccharibacteria bacterium]|nr:hypothetical protein [Candidatus Saccharibacteria bacterium]
MSSNNSSGGAAGTVFIMGVIYWIAFWGTIGIIFAIVASVIVGIFLIYGLFCLAVEVSDWIAVTDRPSWKGLLLWIGVSLDIIALLYLVARLLKTPLWIALRLVFKHHTIPPLSYSLISLAFIGMVLTGVYSSYRLYQWCLEKF